jgi:hypothetical protein
MCLLRLHTLPTWRGNVSFRSPLRVEVKFKLDENLPDIRAYPLGSYPGIWVLRPPKQTFMAIKALVAAAVRLCATETAYGRLWVIDEQRVRIRAGVE